eukprot:3204086-Prymnesium_polylepis.1
MHARATRCAAAPELLIHLLDHERAEHAEEFVELAERRVVRRLCTLRCRATPVHVAVRDEAQ